MTTFMRSAVLMALLAGGAAYGLLAVEEQGSPGEGGDRKIAYPYPLDTCIVTGKKLNSMGTAFSTSYKGRPMSFCCKSCLHKLEEKPDEYLKKLDQAIIEKQKPAYSMTTCPVTGEKLGEGVDLVYMNRLVRFCCKDCIDTFNEDPFRYLNQMDAAAQGSDAKANEKSGKKTPEEEHPHEGSQLHQGGGSAGQSGEGKEAVHERRPLDRCPKCRYVLTGTAGTKPTVALLQGKYELRCVGCRKGEDGSVSCKGCKEDEECPACAKAAQEEELLCNACIKKMYPKGAPSGKTILRQSKGSTEAYVCTKCKTLCWREEGKECVHLDPEECAACEALKANLEQLQAKKACPHCQPKPIDRGTKQTAVQNIRRPCPFCDSSINSQKECKVCKDQGVDCDTCKAAVKERKSK